MSRTNILTIAVLSLILGANVGFAQGFYLSANAGYGLGAGTQSLGTNITDGGTSTAYEGIFGSYGEGFKVGISAGYMFSGNIGAELGFAYWPGKSFESTYRSTPILQTSKATGSGFVVAPSIVISTNLEGINPYARFGVLVGLLKTEQEIKIEQTAGNLEVTLEENGGVAFGYAGALGVDVPTGGAVDFFAEFSLQSLVYSPSQEEITRYIVNGQDSKSLLTRTGYNYKESYNSPSPDEQMAVRRPFSSVGIVVGARINL